MAYQRVYQARYRAKHKDSKLAYYRDYYERNRSTLLAKKALPANRLKRRDENHVRRSRERAQFVERVDPLILYRMHGGCCGVCKQFVSEGEFEVDHRIAIVNGGMHGYANCQPAHPRCNRKKAAA